MIQAKLIGYLGAVDAFSRTIPHPTSEEARYARGMAYFRKPDLRRRWPKPRASSRKSRKSRISGKLLGQIYVDMAQPEKGMGPYQKSVDLLPDAPLLRVSLAAAQLATENPRWRSPRSNLKVSLQQENDNTFAWYEAAQAYSELGNQPMADLSDGRDAITRMARCRVRTFCGSCRAETAQRFDRLATRERYFGASRDPRPKTAADRRFGDFMTDQWKSAAGAVSVARPCGRRRVRGRRWASCPATTCDSRLSDGASRHPRGYDRTSCSRQDAGDGAMRGAGRRQQDRAEGVLRSARGVRHRPREREDQRGRVLRLQLPLLPPSLPALKTFYEAHKNARFAFIEFPSRATTDSRRPRGDGGAQAAGDKYLAFHFMLMNEENVVDQNLLFHDARKRASTSPKLQADTDHRMALTAAHALGTRRGSRERPCSSSRQIREGAIDSALLAKMAKT